MKKAVPYLLAYSIPMVALISSNFGGIFWYSTLVYTFVLLPLVETLLPTFAVNYSETDITSRLQNHWFDVLLYGNVFWVYGLMGYVLYLLTTQEFTYVELVGMVFTLGIVYGANGINVAHELGHRDNKTENLLAKMLLLPSHYLHFFLEHNHGHHVHVSTPEDPSTAKKNQSLYAFWVQSVFGTYVKAWQIQKQFLQKENRSFWHFSNYQFWSLVVWFGFQGSIFYFFGFKAWLVLFFSGVIGFLLLETINYIEHYGLIRSKLPSGRYERVSEKHSWNSNHVIGRMVLYELTQHSDHHYKANKKYQILQSYEQSPQLPFGYPTSMVLAAFPPLWFWLMNPRLPQ
jgi:alkane 1-monooxygenase